MPNRLALKTTPALSERDTLTATGTFNVSMIMRIATARARVERAKCAKIGWARTWNACLGQELKRAWSTAKLLRDSRVAHAEFATLPAAEQLRRQRLHAASNAENAIPARPEDAARYRAAAGAMHQGERFLEAAE